jgi:hypothetical protein
VFEPEVRPVSLSVEDEFGFAEMRIVSLRPPLEADVSLIATSIRRVS